MPARRAVLMRRSDSDPTDVEQLVTEHDLELVQTVIADIASARMNVLIAVDHVLHHAADVIVIPHLTDSMVQQERVWRALTGIVEVITMAGVLAWSAEVSR